MWYTLLKLDISTLTILWNILVRERNSNPRPLYSTRGNGVRMHFVITVPEFRVLCFRPLGDLDFAQLSSQRKQVQNWFPTAFRYYCCSITISECTNVPWNCYWANPGMPKWLLSNPLYVSHIFIVKVTYMLSKVTRLIDFSINFKTQCTKKN